MSAMDTLCSRPSKNVRKLKSINIAPFRLCRNEIRSLALASAKATGYKEPPRLGLNKDVCVIWFVYSISVCMRWWLVMFDEQMMFVWDDYEQRLIILTILRISMSHILFEGKKEVFKKVFVKLFFNSFTRQILSVI